MSWHNALRAIRVLVVEDDYDTREVLGLGLELAGATVALTGSAPEAMESLRQFKPHVLVSDIGLPGENGFDLIRRIRGLEPEDGGNLPAIAVTAYTLADDGSVALHAGFDKYLVKPVDAQVLIDSVAEAARQGHHPGRRPQERRLRERRHASLPGVHQRRHDDRRAPSL